MASFLALRLFRGGMAVYGDVVIWKHERKRIERVDRVGQGQIIQWKKRKKRRWKKKRKKGRKKGKEELEEDRMRCLSYLHR